VQEALDGGAPPEGVIDALDTATREGGDRLALALRRRAPQVLRDHRAVARGMYRRMRALWGPAFDAFYGVYVCVEELGSDLQRLHREDDDPLVSALLGLHARACLVLAEVHALMVRGFPLGAWARTRSLHETAILTTLLATHGRQPGTDDLGERFIRHAIVDQARDLELAIRSGIDVDEEEVATVRAEREAVVERYGSMFAKDYGWARPLFPSLGPRGRVTFEQLERLADAGLHRLDYRVGGHHVHSSAWTVALNVLSRGGKSHQLTGPTNVAFGDSAAVALAAILVSTSAIVHGVAFPPEPMNLVALHALRTLSVEAAQLFAEGQAIVMEREEQLQPQLKAT
jgi:hypothetical protein